ncbi:hypothetical protein P3T43_002485 [Paraburkholderia sp. GAS41]|jgi:hypothetical protein|uniref:hypothetical protein n=1 Tax=Paraburkholderia sp. GAS41 TaxID=3035134 RepID=UPI003D2337AD
MKYEASNSRNTGRDGSLQDTVAEIQPVAQVAPAVQKAQQPTRNWAWAHHTESYDWMDTHSLSGSRDSFH